MPRKLITPPTQEPITLQEAKTHLRVTQDAEDALIQMLIKTAREFAEHWQDRALLTQTWEYYLNDWPDSGIIELPLPPLQSVETISYYLADGNMGILPSTSYTVDNISSKGRIILNPNASWPEGELHPVNPIAIRFTCGYPSPEEVPASTKYAMLLLIGHWYENRQAVGSMNDRPLALAVSSLLALDKVYYA